MPPLRTFVSAVVPGLLSTMEVSCCDIRFISVDLPEFIAPKMPAQSQQSTFMSFVGGAERGGAVPMFVRSRGCPAYARDQLAACFGGTPQTVPTALFIAVRFMLVVMRPSTRSSVAEQTRNPEEKSDKIFRFLTRIRHAANGCIGTERNN